MIEHHICKSGIGYPEDLTLLKKAYDRVLAERGLSEGCPQADEEVLHHELQRNFTE